ncbi:hypothetical protein JRO89_XS04G0049300 [Xanthoceras sorbifolium]|uniref:Uncharacterized protein n=1 Tax=Xanthoceras sorbifolium TaxID=99658 RepID=A0ABQ8I459_9ROSI|nr:hypothetical protein JRO89_XS04G0049300 [Xanthoceras sorbifolium]
MGIPLLLGVSDETEKLTIKILRHKEGNRRTEAIRVILSPRAGSSWLLQLYDAQILLKSRLTWTKEFVRSLEKQQAGVDMKGRFRINKKMATEQEKEEGDISAREGA